MRTRLVIAGMLIARVLSLAAHAAAPATCFTSLVGFVPGDPVHGFPQYYQDANGLALQACRDLVCDPALAVQDPTKPVSFPDNFPLELFYSRAISTITVGTIKAVLNDQFEGSFANGSLVIPGDQGVFGRVRVGMLGGPPGGTYTIAHPYGVEVLQADAVGTVNFTQDSTRIPLVPGGPALAFGTPLATGRIGPFLTAVAPPPPAGFVGNPAAPQTVTGSPCGQNVFGVQGPGFPAGGVQTNQFTVLIGKIAHVCGNGVVDLGEQCDDGNLVAGDCCSPTCQFEPAGQACANNPCISGSTCDGAAACVGGTPTTLPCNDANACTTADPCPAGTCAGGTCVGGPPPVCPPAAPVATVIADALVNAGSPTTNSGASKVLTADASPVKRTFLRINVTGVGQHPVHSVKLHLQVASATGSNSNSGGQMHAVSDCSWGEKTITWKNQPAMGPVLSTAGKCGLKQPVELDVTSAIHAAGVYCFALDSTSTDNVNYNSREATTGRPSVALEVEPDCGCGPAQVPTTTTTTTPAPGATTTTTLVTAGPVGTVLADTYVQSDLPTTNFGTKPQIFVDNGTATNPGTIGVQHTFLRVSVSGVGASLVTGAHLKLQVANVTNSGSVTGGTIHAITNSSRHEHTMTWNTQPAIDGPALATLGACATGQVVDFDVSPAIPGDGVYCFAIDTTSTDSAIYNSREGSGVPPALEVHATP